jgi:hypothetical protein
MMLPLILFFMERERERDDRIGGVVALLDKMMGLSTCMNEVMILASCTVRLGC